MEEKRKLPRKYLMAYSSVYEQSTGRTLGYLCDITLDGLMVISKENLDVNKEIELYIDLPEIPSFTEKILKIKARVAWSRPDLDPKLMNIGFQFVELAEENKPIISQMIETYEFRREGGDAPNTANDPNHV